jgi:flagellar basal-body rod protein FlgB
MDASMAVLMIKALDGLATRQVATAENIANASTPNYRPLRTSFEQALKDAAAQGDDAVQAVTPKIEQAVAGTPDAELRLDMEMATASGTSGRYGALVSLFNRQLQIESLAITGNQ